MANTKIFSKLCKLIFNIGFILLVLSIVYDGINLNIKKNRLKSEITEAEKKVTELDKKRKILEDEIKKVEENEKIEKLARDRLDLHKEGETVYKVID